MSLVRVEMYVTRTCGYCTRAKALLARKGVAWEEHDLSTEPQRIEEMVQRSRGRVTVPQIFINDHHVGGYDDLAALDSAGGLDPLLSP